MLHLPFHESFKTSSVHVCVTHEDRLSGIWFSTMGFESSDISTEPLCLSRWVSDCVLLYSKSSSSFTVILCLLKGRLFRLYRAPDVLMTWDRGHYPLALDQNLPF